MKKAGLLALSALLIIGFGLFGLGNKTKVSAAAAGANAEIIDTDSAGDYPNGSYYQDDQFPRSLAPVISGDGNHIVFGSTATNLVTGTGSNSSGYLYEKTLSNGNIIVVNPDSTTTSSVVAVSYNGRYVLYRYNDNYYSLSDTTAGTTTSFGESDAASMSTDGRFVAHDKSLNGVQQVYVYDTATSTDTLISQDSSGNPGNNTSSDPSIDCGGNVIAFTTEASNINPLSSWSNTYLEYAVFGPSGTITISSGGVGNVDMNGDTLSCDGNHMMVRTVNHTYGTFDVYDVGRLGGTTIGPIASTYASQDSGEGSTDSQYVSMSSDGRYIAFTSDNTGLDPSYPATTEYTYGYDVYVEDLTTGVIHLVTHTGAGTTSKHAPPQISQEVYEGWPVAISADGSKVAFWYQTPPHGDTSDAIGGITAPVGTTSHIDLYAADTGF